MIHVIIINNIQWNKLKNYLTAYTNLYFTYGYNKMKTSTFKSIYVHSHKHTLEYYFICFINNTCYYTFYKFQTCKELNIYS